MKNIFFSARGLRSGWRLLLFVGIFVALGFLAKSTAHRIPTVSKLIELPFLHPVGLIYDELEGLTLVGISTWIMACIERRRLASYGIPLRKAFGRDFWVGIAWGLAATSLVVASMALFGGYRILGFAIHGDGLWYFTGLWIVANLLIGFCEEIQFRSYLLSTLAEGIGSGWPPASSPWVLVRGITF